MPDEVESYQHSRPVPLQVVHRIVYGHTIVVVRRKAVNNLPVLGSLLSGRMGSDALRSCIVTCISKFIQFEVEREPASRG